MRHSHILTNQKESPYFFRFLLCSLFLFGLNIPEISIIVLLLMSLTILLNWNGRIRKDFEVPFILLGLFCIFYYFRIHQFGFVDLRHAFQNPLLMMGAYCLGLSTSRSKVKNWPYGIMWILLSMSAGFVLFALLSVFR